MRGQSLHSLLPPSSELLADGSFARSQGHCDVLLFPPLFFQTPSAFAPFFSPIGFLWCSHTSYGITLYFLLPLSVGELNFWRHYLSNGAPRIICSFGCQHLVIETTLIQTTVVWPGIPEDSRPFSNRRFQEGLFSYADYQAVLSTELGEGDEWEKEEWASEEE